MSLSATGTTLAVGGPHDDGNVGAAWVYTRNSSGSWTQQGAKLGALVPPETCNKAALSLFQLTAAHWLLADPAEQVLCGYNSLNSSSGNWTQQGSKFVGSGAIGSAAQGNSESAVW